jgi:hypothetical protein
VPKIIIYCRMASGIGRPYVFINWSKISFSNIVTFQPTVGGVVGGGNLEGVLNVCI